MRSFITCGLILQTTLGLSAPIQRSNPPVIHAEHVSSSDPLDFGDRQPTLDEVRTALETLKRAGLKLKTDTPKAPFQLARSAGKTAVYSTGASLLTWFFFPMSIETRLMPLFLLTGLTTGAVAIVSIIVTVVATGFEGVAYIFSTAVTPADSAELETGILSDAELLQRYLDLTVEEQLAIGGPRLHRLAVELARPISLMKP